MDGSPAPFGLAPLDESLLKLSLPPELLRFFPGASAGAGPAAGWGQDWAARDGEGRAARDPQGAVAESPPAPGGSGLSAPAAGARSGGPAAEAARPGLPGSQNLPQSGNRNFAPRKEAAEGVQTLLPSAPFSGSHPSGAPALDEKVVSLHGNFSPFDPALAGLRFDPIAYLNENLTEDNLDVLIGRLDADIDRANDSLAELILEIEVPGGEGGEGDKGGGEHEGEDEGAKAEGGASEGAENREAIEAIGDSEAPGSPDSPEHPEKPSDETASALPIPGGTSDLAQQLRQKMTAVVEDVISAEKRAGELISELDVINNARMHIEQAGFSLQVAAKFVALAERLSADPEALQLGYEEFTPALTQMFILLPELEGFSSVPEIGAAQKKYSQVKTALRELEQGIIERSVRSESPDPEARRPKASGATEIAAIAGPAGSAPGGTAASAPDPTPENIDTYKLWSHITVLTAYHAALGSCGEFYDRLVGTLIEFFLGMSGDGDAVSTDKKGAGAAGSGHQQATAKRFTYKDIEDLYKRFLAFLRASKEYLIALERHVSNLTAKGKDALQAYFEQFKFSLFDPTVCFSRAVLHTYLYPALVERFFNALGKALGSLVSGIGESSVPAALSCLLATLEFEARVFDPELAGLDLTNYVQKRPSSIFSPAVPLILQTEARAMRRTCAQAASEYDPSEFLSRYEASGSSDLGLSRSAMKVLGSLRGFLKNVALISSGPEFLGAFEAATDAVVSYCGALTGQLSLPSAVPSIVHRYFGRSSPQARSYELVSILEGTRRAPYDVSLFSSQAMLFVHLSSEALCGLLTLLVLAGTLKEDVATLCAEAQARAPAELQEPLSAASDKAAQAIQKLKVYALLTISAALSGDFVVRGVIPALDPDRIASLSDEKKKVRGNPLSIASDIFMNHIRKCYSAAFRASASDYARGEAGDNIVLSLTNFVGTMIVTIPASVEKVKAVESSTLALMDGVYAALQCSPLNRISQDVLGRLQARLKNTVAYLLMLDGIGIENASVDSFRVLFENYPVEDCAKWLSDIVRYRTRGGERDGGERGGRGERGERGDREGGEGREGRERREGRFRDILANIAEGGRLHGQQK